MKCEQCEKEIPEGTGTVVANLNPRIPKSYFCSDKCADAWWVEMAAYTKQTQEEDGRTKPCRR